jgi:hypothetical protein
MSCINKILLSNSRKNIIEVKVEESEALSETSLFQSKVFTFPSHTKCGRDKIIAIYIGW